MTTSGSTRSLFQCVWLCVGEEQGQDPRRETEEGEADAKQADSAC